MVKVDEYARIRQAHRIDKLSVRQLARRFHHSRRKIREILGQPEPRKYQRRPMPSVVDPFKPVIDQILRADEDAPRKQRHTVAKVFRRLRDEHDYPGSYERVRQYLRAKGRSQRATFIPLDHDPGQRLEADFGHIHVDFPDGRRLVPVLLTTWAYSNCPFAIALPTERTEAILHGLVEAFTFFGCVPRELWWDNPKTVVPHLFVGRQRQLNDRYQALVSHYAFEPCFCMVRQPQEKPHVEGRVRHLQRDWATPVPKVQDLAELNAHLLSCCLRDRERIQAGQSETIGQRFARESDNALSLPEPRFDPCIVQPAKADKYQMVRFDNNRYSGANPRSAALPRHLAAAAGGAGSRQRLSPLAIAGCIQRAARSPGETARPIPWRQALRTCLAVAGRARHRPGAACDRDEPLRSRLRRRSDPAARAARVGRGHAGADAGKRRATCGGARHRGAAAEPEPV